MRGTAFSVLTLPINRRPLSPVVRTGELAGWQGVLAHTVLLDRNRVTSQQSGIYIISWA